MSDCLLLTFYLERLAGWKVNQYSQQLKILPTSVGFKFSNVTGTWFIYLFILNNRHLFFIDLEARKSKINVLVDLVPQ